jgi:hypothetical protein
LARKRRKQKIFQAGEAYAREMQHKRCSEINKSKEIQGQ